LRAPTRQFVALAPRTGKKLWTYSPDASDQVLDVVADAHRAIVELTGPVDSPTPSSRPSDHLVALDTATGTPAWTADLGSWESTSRLVVDAHAVIFHGQTFSSFTPEAPTGKAIPPAPKVFDDGSRLTAFDTVNGSTLWDHHDAGSAQPQAMLAGDANLYVASADGSFVVLNARSGTPHWTGAATTTDSTGSFAIPVGAGSGIVVVAHRTNASGSFDALDAKTGHTRWHSTDPAQTGTVADGSLYIAGGGRHQTCD
jgi:outer membrane protein assembly factor BamB